MQEQEQKTPQKTIVEKHIYWETRGINLDCYTQDKYYIKAMTKIFWYKINIIYTFHVLSQRTSKTYILKWRKQLQRDEWDRVLVSKTLTNI